MTSKNIQFKPYALVSSKKLKLLGLAMMLLGLGLSILLPITVLAAEDVKLDGTLGVANVTSGNKEYAQTTTAKYNEVVKIQVSYRNNEKAASSKTAQKVKVKIDIPATASRSHSIKSSTKGDNTNAVDGQVTVNADNEAATLQYIPGSAVWRHNSAGNSTEPAKYIEQKLTDELVSSADGLVIDNQKAGEKYASTVSVLARVMTPNVKVSQQVQLKSESNKWAGSNTAKPGDTVRYLISYQNAGNSIENKVVIRSMLPERLSLVAGTTTLTNASNPNGKVLNTDELSKGGVTIGNYGAGANAYVSFEAKADAADKLACGTNLLRVHSSAQPENTSEFFASSLTTVVRDCAATAKPTAPTAATPAPTPPKPNPSPTPLATPVAPPASANSNLPNSGPGDVAAIFVVATLAGTIFHRLLLNRYLSR